MYRNTSQMIVSLLLLFSLTSTGFAFQSPPDFTPPDIQTTSQNGNFPLEFPEIPCFGASVIIAGTESDEIDPNGGALGPFSGQGDRRYIFTGVGFHVNTSTSPNWTGSWQVEMAVNPDYLGDATAQELRLGISAGLPITFVPDPPVGPTVSGTNTDAHLVWTPMPAEPLPSTIILSGVMDINPMADDGYIEFYMEDFDGSVRIEFGCSGTPGPVVTYPHPTPCDDSGPGDGGGPIGGCGPCGGCGSGAGSLPGKQAFCPMQPLRSLGCHVDYDASPILAAPCSSCSGGGSLPGGSIMPSIRINRKLIPHELLQFSSFGIGWFADTDYSLEFFPASGSEPARVMFLDLMTELAFDMNVTSTSGVYEEQDGVAHYFDNLTIEGGGAPTAGGFATLRRRNGWEYRFETIDIGSGAMAGRLTEIKSPAGFIKTFNYPTLTAQQIATSPMLQFQLETVTDGYGNVAAYTYASQQYGGRYVVDTIAINGGQAQGGETLTYTYTDSDRLTTVNRNGVPLSIYAYGRDAIWNADTITMNEKTSQCEGNGDTIYLSRDTVFDNGALINQFAQRLLGRSDANGYRYMVVNRDPTDENLIRVENRGRLLDWSVGSYYMYYESFSVNGMPGFDGYDNLVAEPKFARNSTEDEPHVTANEILMAQPKRCTDETGYRMRLFYDDSGNLETIVHPDGGLDFYNEPFGPGATFEKYEYNSLNQMTMYRDREGYVTLYAYDSGGRILQISRGLLDTDGTIEGTNSTTAANVTGVSTKEVFTYHGNGTGLLASSAISLYSGTAPADKTTLYTYTTENRPFQTQSPEPEGAGDRSIVEYNWVDTRLESMKEIGVNENGTDSLMQFAYDDVGRLIKTTYQDGETETHYNDVARFVYTKDRNGIVNLTIRDAVYRVSFQFDAYAVDTDGDLSDGQFDQYNMGATAMILNRYYYHSGRLKPYRMESAGRRTELGYDYRSRQVMSTQYLTPGSKVKYRRSETAYLNNRMFKQSQELKNGTENYTKHTYHGFSADNYKVRIVTCRDDSVTFGDNLAVLNAQRIATTVADPDHSIVDRVVDRRGANLWMINERGICTHYVNDALGRATMVKEGRQLDESAGTFDDTYLMETTNVYDYRGNVTQTINPLGSTTDMVYDNAGNLKQRTVAYGTGGSDQMVWSYKYDRKGRQKTETLPSGGINTNYYSDCCGRQSGSKNAQNEGRVTVMNSGGQVVYQAGVVDSYDFTQGSYDNIAVGDKLSEATRRYGPDGRLKFQTVWDTALAPADVDPSDPPIAGLGSHAIVDGVTTQYAYLNMLMQAGSNNNGVQVDKLHGGGTFDVNLDAAITELSTAGINFAFYHNGSAQIVIAPDEKTYTFSISDSLGRSVMSGVSYGPAATEGTANDLINYSITKYDTTDTVDGIPVEVITSVDVDGTESYSKTDGFGRAIESVQSEGAHRYASRMKYNVSGSPLESVDANGNDMVYTYDLMGRQLTMKTDPGDLALETVTVYYDDTGLVKSRRDARLNLVEYQATDYDLLGRMIKERDRLDAVVTDNFVERLYDSAGHLASVTDQEGKVTLYEYDLLGRKTKTTYDNDQEETVAYDDLGRMQTRRLYGPLEDSSNNNLGLQHEYSYEYSGVVDKITFTSHRDSTSYEHDFTYNDVLQRTNSINTGDQVARVFTYTDRGQLKTEELDYDTSIGTNLLFTTTYGYDDEGRLETIDYPTIGGESRTVTYGYNDRNLLKEIRYPTTNLIEDRTFDDGGRLTNITRPAVDEIRNYDAANRLTSISNAKSGSPAADQVGKISYTYDANGNKTGETWSEGPTAMTDWNVTIGAYDKEDRFGDFNRSGAAATHVSIDRSVGGGNTIGNVEAVNFITGDTGLEITGTRTFGDTYQLESTGNVNQVGQVYNEEGQLTTSHWGSTFDWDIAGRMTEATVPTNPGVGIEGSYNYGYDADGRRVWRKKQGDDEVTVFVYGGPNVISDVTIDITSPSTPIVDSVHRYVYGATVDELVMVEQDDDTELGVTRNGQWSVMSLYGMSSGTIQKRFNYGVFGQRHVVDPDGTYNSNPTADLGVPYGYTSRRHDAETGMMYFRARYYDPTTGEFTSKDPLGYVDGMSLYRGYFVPTMIDPSGLAINKCRCERTYNHYEEGPTTSSSTIFANGSCQSACCKNVPSLYTKCKGTAVAPTPDEKKVIGLCGGRTDCERSITVLMNRVRRTKVRCIPFNVLGLGPGEDGYCFKWLIEFKKCYTYTEWDDKATTTLPGGCTMELLEVMPYPEKLNPETGTVITKKSRLGPYVGQRPWGYSSHGIGRVCCGTGASRSCMYFDVGSQSHTGQFGGDDKWFCPDDENFLDELDGTTEVPFK